MFGKLYFHFKAVYTNSTIFPPPTLRASGKLPNYSKKLLMFGKLSSLYTAVYKESSLFTCTTLRGSGKLLSIFKQQLLFGKLFFTFLKRSQGEEDEVVFLYTQISEPYTQCESHTNLLQILLLHIKFFFSYM